MPRVVSVLLLLLSILPNAAGQSLDDGMLRAQLDRVLDDHVSALRTTVTVKVVDLKSGRILFDRGGDRLMVPASNLKSFTTACALDTFGPNKVFPTRLVTKGPTRDGTLHGDLVLVGGGNSMLTVGELQQLAGRVQDELKIKRILGSVKVDNSRYAATLKGPGWMWDDDPSYFNMSITPFMLDFNVLTVRLSPAAGGGVSAALVPASPFPPLRSISNTVRPAGPRVTRAPFEAAIIVVDRGPIDEPQETRLTMHDPGPWAAAVFRQMLTDHGVDFGSGANHPPSEEKATAMSELLHEGKPLSAALEHFNEASENAVGEVLLHEVAIAHGIQQPSWDEGSKKITNWLVNTAGLAPGSFRYVDGSGLSRYNLITADSAVKLLSFMHTHPHQTTFLAALPKYDVDLEGIERPNAQRRPQGEGAVLVAAKSGYMSGVATSSGYLTTLTGRRLAFSILANGFIGSAKPIHDLREKVWRVLVRYAPQS